MGGRGGRGWVRVRRAEGGGGGARARARAWVPCIADSCMRRPTAVQHSRSSALSRSAAGRSRFDVRAAIRSPADSRDFSLEPKPSDRRGVAAPSSSPSSSSRSSLTDGGTPVLCAFPETIRAASIARSCSVMPSAMMERRFSDPRRALHQSRDSIHSDIAAASWREVEEVEVVVGGGGGRRRWWQWRPITSAARRYLVFTSSAGCFPVRPASIRACSLVCRPSVACATGSRSRRKQVDWYFPFDLRSVGRRTEQLARWRVPRHDFASFALSSLSGYTCSG